MNISTIPTPSNHCSPGALTGTLGLFVQALLAFIAFSALIVKRYCEPVESRRPWKTWCLDTSKQAVGAGFIHIINVINSEHLFHGDPCSWYIISFMLDSTLGLIIICVGLKLSLWIIIRKRWHFLVFGTYAPPSPCKSWFYQCIVYIGVLVIEKITITLVTLFPFWEKVGDWILNGTTNANLELIMVMFVIPLIVNAIIFWIVDNFLKLHHHPLQKQPPRKTKDSIHPIPCQVLDQGYKPHYHPAEVRPSHKYQALVNNGDERSPLVRVDLDDDEEIIINGAVVSKQI